MSFGAAHRRVRGPVSNRARPRPASRDQGRSQAVPPGGFMQHDLTADPAAAPPASGAVRRRHPSVFEPATLALIILLCVFGAIIGMQILVSLGVSANTSLIGALAAMVLARIPLRPVRPLPLDPRPEPGAERHLRRHLRRRQQPAAADRHPLCAGPAGPGAADVRRRRPGDAARRLSCCTGCSTPRCSRPPAPGRPAWRRPRRSRPATRAAARRCCWASAWRSAPSAASSRSRCRPSASPSSATSGRWPCSASACCCAAIPPSCSAARPSPASSPAAT